MEHSLLQIEMFFVLLKNTYEVFVHKRFVHKHPIN